MEKKEIPQQNGEKMYDWTFHVLNSLTMISLKQIY